MTIVENEIISVKAWKVVMEPPPFGDNSNRPIRLSNDDNANGYLFFSLHKTPVPLVLPMVLWCFVRQEILGHHILLVPMQGERMGEMKITLDF